MTIKLRKHQSDLNQCIDGIINQNPRFKDIKDIIMAVVPGGGKGSVGVNAGKLLMAGLADSICLIVPRTSLATQCEQVFMDPFFKKLFGVNLRVRASTNEHDPCRGMNGFVTTYQALGVDKHNLVAKDVASRRTIVILDEFHHVEEDFPWHKAVEDILKAAKYRILMSGTLSRANKSRIACVKYKDGYVDLRGDKNTHVIKYTRSEALREQAILPISFHLHDGSLEWEEHNGRRKQVSSFASVEKKDKANALYTALETEFSEQLIENAVVHWLKHKEKVPGAKILFVCARIEDARRTMAFVDNLGIPNLIATSHYQDCRENIEKFKASQAAPALVTINVGYEGLDVPPISHVCVLTRIRSFEWLEQCVSRGTRYDKESGPYRDQLCHVFAPKDPSFVEFMGVIEKEQVTRTKNPKEKEEQLDLFELPEEPSEGSDPNGPCIPLRSQILELSEKVIGKINFKVEEPVIATPKMEELSLRKRIDKHLKKYALVQGYEFQHIMADAKRTCGGKARNLLTLDELEDLMVKIKQQYPLEDTGNFIHSSSCPPNFKQAREPFELAGQKFF